jgi:hypothetical protein
VGGGRDRRVLAEETRGLLHRFAVEHDQLRDTLALLVTAADEVAAGARSGGLAGLDRVDRLLADRILPHEQAEEAELYPALAVPLGREATAPMSRTHAEITRLARRLHTHLEVARQDGEIGPEQFGDVLACLYGLHAVLRLHFLQEEECYFSLDPAASRSRSQDERPREEVPVAAALAGRPAGSFDGWDGEER